MLSALTVQKAGTNKELAHEISTLEMFHSSPEGEDLQELVAIFQNQYSNWTLETIHSSSDFAVLRDTSGDYWIAQSMVYSGVCVVEHS